MELEPIKVTEIKKGQKVKLALTGVVWEVVDILPFTKWIKLTSVESRGNKWIEQRGSRKVWLVKEEV
jgi:hypothetical protein